MDLMQQPNYTNTGTDYRNYAPGQLNAQLQSLRQPSQPFDELEDIKMKKANLEREIASKPNAGNYQQALSMLKYYDSQIANIETRKINERKMVINEQNAARAEDQYKEAKKEKSLQRQKEEGFNRNYRNTYVNSKGQEIYVPSIGQSGGSDYGKAMAGYILGDSTPPSPDKFHREMPKTDPRMYQNMGDVRKAQGDLKQFTPYNETQAGQMQGLDQVLGNIAADLQKDTAEKKKDTEKNTREARLKELQNMPQETAADLLKVAYKAAEYGEMALAQRLVMHASEMEKGKAGVEKANKKNADKTKKSKYTPEERTYLFSAVPEEVEDDEGNIKRVNRPPTKEEINQRAYELTGEPFFPESQNKKSEENFGLVNVLGNLVNSLAGGVTSGAGQKLTEKSTREIKKGMNNSNQKLTKEQVVTAMEKGLSGKTPEQQIAILKIKIEQANKDESLKEFIPLLEQRVQELSGLAVRR